MDKDINWKDMIKLYGKDNHHYKEKSYLKMPKIANNILEVMGKTPLIRMKRLEKHYGLNV